MATGAPSELFCNSPGPCQYRRFGIYRAAAVSFSHPRSSSDGAPERGPAAPLDSHSSSIAFIFSTFGGPAPAPLLPAAGRPWQQPACHFMLNPFGLSLGKSAGDGLPGYRRLRFCSKRSKGASGLFSSCLRSFSSPEDSFRRSFNQQAFNLCLLCNYRLDIDYGFNFYALLLQRLFSSEVPQERRFSMTGIVFFQGLLAGYRGGSSPPVKGFSFSWWAIFSRLPNGVGMRPAARPARWVSLHRLGDGPRFPVTAAQPPGSG